MKGMSMARALAPALAVGLLASGCATPPAETPSQEAQDYTDYPSPVQGWQEKTAPNAGIRLHWPWGRAEDRSSKFDWFNRADQSNK